MARFLRSFFRVAGVYRPRHPEHTVLCRVLFHYFDRFLAEYEGRFENEYGFLRPIVKEVTVGHHEARRAVVIQRSRRETAKLSWRSRMGQPRSLAELGTTQRVGLPRRSTPRYDAWIAATRAAGLPAAPFISSFFALNAALR